MRLPKNVINFTSTLSALSYGNAAVRFHAAAVLQYWWSHTAVATARPQPMMRHRAFIFILYKLPHFQNRNTDTLRLATE